MMTPGFAKSRQELFWLPYPEPDKVIINAHNMTPAAFDPSVNGKMPSSVWCPSRDDAGNGTTTLTDLIASNDGTLTNMDPATDWVADTDAGGVRALDFDGSNDYVDVGSPGFAASQGVISVSAWVKRSTGTGPRTIIGEYSNIDLGQFIVRLNGASHLVEFYWSNAVRATSSTGISDTNWHHVVAVRSGSAGSWSVSFFIDGVAAGTTPGITVNPPSTNRGVNIGKLSTLSLHYWTGRLDDIRVFDQSLTITDASDMWNSGSGRGVSV